ncbi:hypothetical protein Tco_1395786 [Tanacetum coccineum]
MRMKQYLTFTDHALWEVIVNGDSVTPIASASTGAEGHIPPKTAEQKLARKNKLKAKSTLMLAIPDEHLISVRIYQKSQDNSQKRASTDTKIRRVQKSDQKPKSKPEKSSLKLEAQHVTSKNDMLAILRCPQINPTAKDQYLIIEGIDG